jgi:hypothetical protein
MLSGLSQMIQDDIRLGGLLHGRDLNLGVKNFQGRFAAPSHCFVRVRFVDVPVSFVGLCLQNYSIRYLSRDTREFWDTLSKDILAGKQWFMLQP